MRIGRKQVEENYEIKDEVKKIEYQTPEILMIDCDNEECDKLKEKGFNIDTGSFGRLYRNVDQHGNKNMIFNGHIDNIIEKDVIIVDMKQKSTDDIYKLADLKTMEDGSYFVTKDKQRECNPINGFSKMYENDFRKLRAKDSIFIVFADKEVSVKYDIITVKEGYYLKESEEKVSNYEFLPFSINVSDKSLKSEKYKIVAEGNLKGIFKNYKGKICGGCTFWLGNYNHNNTARLVENTYGDTIGYIQISENENKTKNTLIVLPQCENISVIVENIITEVLPIFYPEMCKDFVKDTWMEKEEYLLPDIKNLIKKRDEIENEYCIKIEEINKKIREKERENEFLYDIISSNGTGDKLVESIIKSLEYLEYFKVEDCDKVRDDDEKEEDIHIYTDANNYYIAEVKGINGPPVEDDCNVIVKYKSRNCAKLNISSIHGVVFVNYHKNVEPNRREELGFSKKEIKDAIRDNYTLVGTYELFKAIRLYQEGILKKEQVRKMLEMPGLFNAIPTSFEYIGKIEKILDKINVMGIPLECQKICLGEEVLIVNNNNYYKAKILSMQVNDEKVEEALKGDEVGIKIDENIPDSKSAKVYLIR